MEEVEKLPMFLNHNRLLYTTEVESLIYNRTRSRRQIVKE